MKCLVTGAAGFIGSHLCEELVSRGHKVTAFVHYNSRNDIGNLRYLPEKTLSRISVVKGDVQDPFSVESAVRGQECVYHLAALIGIPYSYVAPGSYISTNVQGTLNVLEAVRKHKIKKMVHTSTSETYGSAQYTPMDEKHPLQGQSPYSASKIGADQIAESYFRSFSTPVATIRPFNTYGPRQSARAVIPTIISQLLMGITDVKLGSAETVRDFNYVMDTVEGFIRVAESEKTAGKVLNVGSGKGQTIAETFGRIAKLIGCEARIVVQKERVRPSKSEVVRLLSDCSLAKKMIGYKPTWTFDQGLAATIDFIRDNMDQYNSKEYMI